MPTVCGNERGFYVPFSCSTTSNLTFSEPCSAVSASAPFIYSNLLPSCNVHSLLPTKILSAQPQSRTAYLRLQTTSWLINFILTDVYAPNADAPAAIFSSLGTAFGSVGFHCAGSFFSSLQRAVNVQFIRDIVASSLLRLRRCFLQKCFLVIWILCRQG